MSEWQAVMRSDGITIRRRAVAPSSPATGGTLVQAIETRVRSAWKWLENKRSAHFTARRLHVAETLSLGEKRFVSIIEVDGTQYLIGGSAGSVQLLSRLDTLPGLKLPVHSGCEVDL